MDITTKATKLREAATIMQERGLARWDAEAPNRSVCIGGALSLALTGRANCWNSDVNDLLNDVSRTLCRLGRMKSDSTDYPYAKAVNWNNTVARDADEVAQMLKLTAEDIELGAV